MFSRAQARMRCTSSKACELAQPQRFEHALEAEDLAIIDGRAVEDVARREDDGLVHQREHDRVAQVLRRLIELRAQELCELWQHVRALWRAACNLKADGDLPLDLDRAEQARASGVDVTHLDSLGMPPQPLDVRKLQAERA